MTPSQILLAGCVCFIGAVGLASFWDFNQVALLVIFVWAIFLTSVFWKRKPLMIAGILMGCVGLGIGVHEIAQAKAVNNELRKFLLQEIAFEAKVIREPQRKEKSTQVVVRPEFVSQGNVLLIEEAKERFQYGDRVRVKGKLEEAGMFDDFDYAAFLAKHGVYAVMFKPEIQLVKRASYEGIGERLFGALLWVKQHLRSTLHEHLAPPGSTIAAAILLGDKGTMSSETQEKLNAAGVRHITAISGMHVAILTSMLMSLLLWLGFWRQQAFYGTVMLILSFVAITGFQASAIRAGIMGGMALLGQYVGRESVSFRALVFAATAILAANPFLLKSDLGFQLSFLAVLGIILFSPIFQHLTRKIPESIHNLRDITGMTIASQIFTLPILLFNFDFFSLVSLATNVLIVPLLFWFMGFGYLFLIVGSVMEPLAFMLSLPLSLFLMYMEIVIDFFSSLPFAAVRIHHLSFVWLLLFYAPVLHFYWKFRTRHHALFV